jgi:hypothetical protein
MELNRAISHMSHKIRFCDTEIGANQARFLLVAHCVSSPQRINSGAIGGVADMPRSLWHPGDANKPFRTSPDPASMGLCGGPRHKTFGLESSNNSGASANPLAMGNYSLIG